jgi:hypothetical protein
MKNKYDTSVILLYLTNQESLLPKEFRKKIPYSTIASWRKADYGSYLGSEFRFLFDDQWDIIRLKSQNQRLKRLLKTTVRCWLQLKEERAKLLSTARNDRALQKALLSIIETLTPEVGLSLALKLIGIGKTKYYEWVVISRQACKASFQELCLRRYPNQLTREEIQKMEQLLTSPTYQHWPIVSVAGMALRERKVMAGLCSWYKYAKALHLSHTPFVRSKKQIGIVTKHPNEYLHIDTTYYHITLEKRVCITFVMDNFSKMILSFSVAEKLTFSLVIDAISKALPQIEVTTEPREIVLVADGGRENNNKEVDQYILSQELHRLTKVIALKDIQFSNSPIEAVHKIMKGRYLCNRKFDSLEHLQTFLKEAVYDYNYLRPHYKHVPRTPAEVYYSQALNFNKVERMKMAAINRLMTNKKASCSECKSTCMRNCNIATINPAK